jgi:D-3-phosphoglycerate dehydrogenase / 2-oxoglutarate reductase
VSDQGLFRALSEGWIGGAGLDDIEEEPARQRGPRLRGVQVVRVLAGQPPLSPVNAAQVASTAARRGLPDLSSAGNP